MINETYKKRRPHKTHSTLHPTTSKTEVGAALPQFLINFFRNKGERCMHICLGEWPPTRVVQGEIMNDVLIVKSNKILFFGFMMVRIYL